jgi:Pectate lyase superfamily protein
MPYTPYYPGGWQNSPTTSTPIIAAALQNIETGVQNAWTLPNAVAPPYGADPTGTTECHAAIQTAANAGLAYLPAGTYQVSAPITVSTAGCGLIGPHGRWYHGTSGSAVIQPSATFSGSQVINVTASEVELGNLTIDCSNLSGTTVDGLDMTGPVLNPYVHDMLIRNSPGYGFQAVYSSGNPAQANFRKVIVDGTLGHAGFNISNMTDSMFDNCYAIGTYGQGWYIYGNGGTKLVGCRAEWSGNSVGYQIDGSGGTGNFAMIGCSTDRNYQHGLQFTCTGTGPVLVSGFTANRDGAGSTSASYAGVMFASGVTNRIIIDGLAVTTGQNDGGGGNSSPQYGVYVTSPTAPTYVAISNAYLNGVSAGQDNITSGNHCHTRMVYTEPDYPPSGTITALTDIT